MTTASSHDDRLSLPRWAELSKDAQRELIQGAVRASLGDGFEPDGELAVAAGWLTFGFRHRASGVRLRFVPGGAFSRGFSDEEEHALSAELEAAEDEDAANGLAILPDLVRSSRPVARVTVAPFLLAIAPLDEAAVGSLLGGAAAGSLPDTVTQEGAIIIARALAASGLRLPAEAEHEWAYRAGTTTPFPWGAARPEDPWAGPNRFGFEDLGEFAEACADGWHADHEGAPSDGAPRDPLRSPLTVRGGSGAAWPWQGCGEWLSMLSAARGSSASYDGLIRIRPARSL